MLGNDYDLFRNTPIADLAEAVENRDSLKIEQLSKELSKNINYQESKFGQTILMVSAQNENVLACRILLRNGAIPNTHDSYDGSSAIIQISGKYDSQSSEEILQLLLKHGASPNDIEVGDRREGNYQRNTPLLRAAGRSLQKVKMLVAAGANINYVNEFGESALGRALTQDKLDIVLYLIESGADLRISMSKNQGKDYYISDELRFKTYFLDSDEYRLKMKIVEMLESKGLPYRSLPVPDYATAQAKKMYPSSWKEYLKKY
ncbi:MAG TPA: ankyrin repeat domain-containing protein [Chryseosolibacter sp.]